MLQEFPAPLHILLVHLSKFDQDHPLSRLNQPIKDFLNFGRAQGVHSSSQGQRFRAILFIYRIFNTTPPEKKLTEP
jgi:hypothetical protein